MYWRWKRMSIVAAYVEGRPTPVRSISLMSVAAVKRGGGFVSCRRTSMERSSRTWPRVRGGNLGSAASFFFPSESSSSDR